MKAYYLIATIITLALAGTGTAYADVSAEKAAQFKVEIKQLVDTYAITRDNNDAVGYANTFAEDGALILYGNTYTGRAVIQKRVEDARPGGVSMHVMSSGQIKIVDDTHATGIHYMSLYSGTKGEDFKEGDTLSATNLVVMGKYHDKYVLTDAGWKFSERRLEAIFRPTN